MKLKWKKGWYLVAFEENMSTALSNNFNHSPKALVYSVHSKTRWSSPVDAIMFFFLFHTTQLTVVFSSCPFNLSINFPVSLCHIMTLPSSLPLYTNRFSWPPRHVLTMYLLWFNPANERTMEYVCKSHKCISWEVRLTKTYLFSTTRDKLRIKVLWHNSLWIS